MAPILVAVATPNAASRRVLEKNGFALVDERIIESEPGDGPTALYRLTGAEPDPNRRAEPGPGGDQVVPERPSALAAAIGRSPPATCVRRRRDARPGPLLCAPTGSAWADAVAQQSPS